MTSAKQLKLRPVARAEVADLGLMLHWKFFHAVPGEGLVCWLCGRTASYVTESTRNRPMPWCAKHARDF